MWWFLEQVTSAIMPEAPFDIRAAVNAISDVVQNRPRPLREFDQIYMKAGDMVLQSDLIAHWANGKKLAFIGDGDAISVCVTYLHARKIIPYGPTRVAVFDFDERICNAIARFADSERLGLLSTVHYNVLDALNSREEFDCFYTNPPWGASNEGESVKVFIQRGMEAVRYKGDGVVVIGDDPELEWTQRVLVKTQEFALQSGYYVQRLMPQLHVYHLDDAPELQSCNLMLRALPNNRPPGPSEDIRDPSRLENFYGRDAPPRVRYVREKLRLDYGKANENEYELELWAEDR